uniref:Phosphate transport system permease protein PstA n=1 Tax=Serratia marcescens TaxID=615 RepID=Q2PDK9_SERMA|nr:phosphate specific tranporter A [Serratia marcescens]
MKSWVKSGSPWVWLTAGSVAVSLLALIGILLLLAGQGMRYFWPSPVYQFELNQNGAGPVTLIGELYQQQSISRRQLSEAGVTPPGEAQSVERYLIKVGNREREGQDFRTLWPETSAAKARRRSLLVLERDSPRQPPTAIWQAAEDGNRSPAAIWGRRCSGSISCCPNVWRGSTAIASATRCWLRDMHGQTLTIPLSQVRDAWYPNAMNTVEKLAHWGEQVKKFLTDSPREELPKAGVFPAIFGTVLMVILMSIVVMPFGVIAAVYLHEYAGNNLLTRGDPHRVVNLAGVPSIVYGVFGLGFFVYMIGGTLDQLFYPESLPNPTFGTPGVVWTRLSLALLTLLTLPVVIVATEEGLSRIPTSLRQGSMALGASRAETLWRIVLPMAAPAMMTGLILAVARAAGETAPLMLVGVVKSVPVLPVDEIFPYLHLERKFMHLSFQIYDMAFQSPTVEAARPLVFATAFLLVTIEVSLNLAAMGIRHSLRERYRAWSQ